jgi:hypothetical protein
MGQIQQQGFMIGKAMVGVSNDCASNLDVENFMSCGARVSSSPYAHAGISHLQRRRRLEHLCMSSRKGKGNYSFLIKYFVRIGGDLANSMKDKGTVVVPMQKAGAM